MSSPSTPDLLALHAVRVLGYATTQQVSARFGLDEGVAEELLLDAQASGWVTWDRFADSGGWSLTEAGKGHGERLLTGELDSTAARAVVERELDGFGPLNDLVAGACTRWQLTELGIAQPPTPLASVLGDLTRAADGLAALEARLTAALARFAGYHRRFTAALARAHDDHAWITGTDRDSAHRVWFELHEDLLATLGRSR